MNGFDPKSILCGVDFSAASEAALGYTALLARAYAARVEVLHSHHVELPAYLGQEQWVVLQSELKVARASLEDEMRQFAAPVLGDLAAVAHYVPLDEPPVEGLLKTVESHHPDLVVLGSHGHNRLNQFLLGSVSSGVLREITVPLLVVRHRADVTPKIERVLCPINFTPTAAAGLQAAASVAQHLGAHLSVIHSLEGGGDAAAERERLCQWVPAQVQAECTWEASPVVDGPAAERIVQAAADTEADLIVLGGRRRSLLAATLLGATTERVVRHAPCPVLTIVGS